MRHPRGGELPLPFRRQALTRPAAKVLRLVPAHVPHRLVGLQRLPPLKAALLPLVIHFAPIARRGSSGVHILHVLRVAHGPLSDAERFYVDFVRPFLIVEDEPLLVPLSAKAKRAAG